MSNDDDQAFLREIVDAVKAELLSICDRSQLEQGVTSECWCGPANDTTLYARHDQAVLSLLWRSLGELDLLQAEGSRSEYDGPTRRNVEIRLDTLSALAHQQINAVPFFLVNKRWLGLCTDAAVLRAVSHLFAVTVTSRGPQTACLQCVERLDRAIIVAGAIGERRMEWVQRLLGMLQQLLAVENVFGKDPPTKSGHADVVVNHDSAHARPAKRPRTSTPTPQPTEAELYYAPTAVPSTAVYPSVDGYLTNHLDAPLILRGYLASASSPSPPWPALDRWQSASYILGKTGRGRFVPVEVGGAYTERDWTQRIMPFEEFLSKSGFAGAPARVKSAANHEDADDDGTDERPIYLAQHGLFDQFPKLQADFALPEYVWSDPPPPNHVPQYKAPAQPVINVWIGQGGGRIVSPAHTDPYYNCYAQVVGQKRVWLAPPSCGPHMYAYGNQADSDSHPHAAHSLDEPAATDYMTNTSSVPILRPIDEYSRALARFPEFIEHVVPVSLEAVLDPGDLLLLPPGWWHAMRGEGDRPGWSVSMWY